MRHKDWSYIKSMIRLGGYGLLLFKLEVAVLVLVLSEIVGIFEEVGEEE